MAIQSITNVRCKVHKSKNSVVEWDAKKDRWVSLTATLTGEDMYHFLAKLIEIVMPRIKEWPGVSGRAGDETGNITLGLTPEEFALFPEIEANYDMYPPQMIPGCHITIITSAVRSREGRMLLSAFGVPFDGKMKR
jgi:large subunit ribosomal protein L5